MSENASSPDDSLKEDRAPFKQRWRDKIFSSEGWRAKEGQEQEKPDDEVARFLGASDSKPKVKPLPLPVITARLDTTQSQPHPIAPLESDLSPIQDFYQKPRPRLNKGLTVSFVPTKPVIIGEGGDDADLPAREVARARATSDGSAPVVLPALPRRSTGAASYRASDPASLHAPESAKTDGQGVPIAWSSPRTSQNTQPEPEQKLRPSHYQHPGAGIDMVVRGRDMVRKDANLPTLRKPLSKSPQNLSPESATLVGNSLTPDASPAPYTRSSPASPPSGQSMTPLTRDGPYLPEQRRSPDRRTAETDDHTHARKAPHLRDIARGLGRDALDQFDASMQPAEHVFHLSVSAHPGGMNVSFPTWIRAAAWWFLKGRQELESIVRGRVGSPQNLQADISPNPPRSLTQAYMDLFKAWWIVKEITPNHKDIKIYGNASMPSMIPIIEGFGNRDLAELVEVHVAIIANLRALTMSMKRNGRLPPQPFDVQGLDTQLIIEYPNLPRDVVHIESGYRVGDRGVRAPFLLPVSDTPLNFIFGRVFARTSLTSQQNGKDNVRIPCVISLAQSRYDGALLAFVASQDGQVSIIVGGKGDDRHPLPWSRLRWIKQASSIVIPLSPDFELCAALTERDFKHMSDTYSAHQTTRMTFERKGEEVLLFECLLRHFERLETPNEPGGFPQGPIPDCRMRLFARPGKGKDPKTRDGKGLGHRVVVRTPPGIKSLRALSVEFRTGNLMLFNPLNSREGPCLILRAPELPSLFVEFQTQDECGTFQALMKGISISEADHISTPLPLRKYDISMTSALEGSAERHHKLLEGFRWRQAQLVSQRRQTDEQSSTTPKIQRMIIQSDYGHFVDHFDPDIGEVQLALDTENYNEIRLLRPPLPTITWSLEDRFPKDIVDAANQLLKATAQSSTIRTFGFGNLKDTHEFQSRLTGYSVLFDGNACKFAISRRVMVMPLHKHWEASSTRIQILQRDKTVQLAAFFKDFEHASCMNLEVRATDSLETSTRSGLFFLRVVDAKFHAPKGEGESARDFICLTAMEYPSEHDDITIGFDNEEMRDRFASHLPAPVHKASRLGSLRR